MRSTGSITVGLFSMLAAWGSRFMAGGNSAAAPGVRHPVVVTANWNAGLRRYVEPAK